LFPDERWAPSRGSFQTPVAPPTVDPDADPTKSIAINCSWLPFIRGALQQLLLQSTWKVADQAGLDLAQARAATLISMLTECDEVLTPFECIGIFGPGGSANPFATFTLGFVGVYNFANGYENTDGSSGGCWYRGIELNIAFDSPIAIGDIAVHGSVSKHSPSGGCNDTFWLRVTDTDAHVNLGTPLHFGDLPSGPGAIDYHTGPYGSETSNLQILLLCDEADTSGGFGALSFCTLTGLDIAGESLIPPC